MRAFDLFDFVVIHIVTQFNVMIYVVEKNEWGYGLYGGAGNLLTFVSFCDKNMGVQVICGADYSPQNMVLGIFVQHFSIPHLRHFIY